MSTHDPKDVGASTGASSLADDKNSTNERSSSSMKTPDSPVLDGEKHENNKSMSDPEKQVQSAAADTKDAKDPNVVDWESPEDPHNPQNWTKAKKMSHIMLVSLSVLYVNLATTMFAPGANLMQQEFGFTNENVEILTITIASLGFAAGQFWIPPLSEVFGRLPVYQASGILYLGFTAGCARSSNVAEFLAFRFLTGLAAASYMSTGGGTIADLLAREERGVAMAMFTAAPLFGPVSFHLLLICMVMFNFMLTGCRSLVR